MFDWIRDLLLHSFVLNAGQESYFDTFKYLEALIEEHRANPQRSRLLQYVPSVGRFFTPLPLSQAFLLYDTKYAISARRHVSPSFNEIRHIMNLSQVNAIGRTLSFISFDGDQTLYSDGGNFADDNVELADAIISLMRAGVIAACVTAAGYGYDGPRYETRLSGLLKRFVTKGLSAEEVSRFYVCGGECNYLMQCSLVPTSEAGGASSSSAPATAFAARLLPVPVEKWQAEALGGPRPFYWPAAEVTQILDVAEATLRTALVDLRLRAKILRKERAIGLYPGGDALSAAVPNGHGSKKLKREALDECVLRVAEALTMARPPITLPYCVFNGGRDAWIDVGNKSVGVRALQKFLALEPARCLHVGDQFLRTGNDLAARETVRVFGFGLPFPFARLGISTKSSHSPRTFCFCFFACATVSVHLDQLAD